MTGGDFRHAPVMPGEVLGLLQPRSEEVYLDGTLGGGGHARLILEASAPDGRLIGIDRDPGALERAAAVLEPFGPRVVLRHAAFGDLAAVAAELEVGELDGVLFDLGVSSPQLDEGARGFSFRSDAPLDMRMDPTGGTTAAELLASAEVGELRRIFREYGEERWAGRIARRIDRVRRQGPLTRTAELAELVRDAVPKGRAPARIHPATRVFQALRIAVNDELEQLQAGLESALELLRPGGRLVVISFHSLEDRIVKRFFKAQARGCTCPPRLPSCVCGHTPRAELLTRKGVRPAEREVLENPRARSAILRGIRRSI